MDVDSNNHSDTTNDAIAFVADARYRGSTIKEVQNEDRARSRLLPNITSQ